MCMPASQPLLRVLFCSALLGRSQSAHFPEQGRPSTSSPAISANLVKELQVCYPPAMVEGGSSSEYTTYTGLELDLQDLLLSILTQKSPMWFGFLCSCAICIP